MTTPTTHYSWGKPLVTGDNNAWGTELNAIFDSIDSTVFTISGVANAALPLAGSTSAANPMTGRLDAQTATMAATSLGTVSGGTLALDCTAAQCILFTVGAAIPTFTITLPSVHLPAIYAFGLILRITNGGAFTITWPTASFKFPSGTAPALTASGTDLLAFLYTSTAGQFELIGIQLNVH